MTRTRTLHHLVRLAAGLLTLTALLLGLNLRAPRAHAAEPGAPELLSVRLDAPNLYATFRDHATDERSFRIVARPRDQAYDGFPVGTRSADVRGAPGTGHIVTGTVTGIKPDVGYCVTVSWFRSALGSLDKLLDEPGTVVSNQVCANPGDTAARPDLAVTRIGGAKELARGRTAAYAVSIRNNGADAIGTVEVLITTSRAVTRAESLLPNAGFTCTPIADPVGEVNGGVRCTGGTLKAGETASLGIFVRMDRPGLGYVDAAVSVRGGTDANTANNAAVLAVTVT